MKNNSLSNLKNLWDDYMLDFFADLKAKWPEYRILYYPHCLIVKLWEKLFDKTIWSEDTHNNAYLFELNRYFEKVWSIKANEILDKLELENPIIISDYHLKLKKFINIIKNELTTWNNNCFNLNIKPEDTIEILKNKIENKKDKIRDFINKGGYLYILSNLMWINRWEKNIILAQISDMIYLAIEFILKDNWFLNELLKNNQWKISDSTSDWITWVIGSVNDIIEI